MDYITLGKIVDCDTQAHAKELFLNRRKHGIGGVTFYTDAFNLPALTKAQKLELSKFKVSEVDEDPELSRMNADNEIGQNLARYMCQLSREFNPISKTRNIIFNLNDDLATAPHIDRRGIDGYGYGQIEGAGLICFNPIGDDPVNVKLDKPLGNFLDITDLNRLIAEKKIEAKTIKAGQILFFDSTLAHESAKPDTSTQGDRLRARAISFS